MMEVTTPFIGAYKYYYQIFQESCFSQNLLLNKGSKAAYYLFQNYSLVFNYLNYPH